MTAKGPELGQQVHERGAQRLEVLWARQLWPALLPTREAVACVTGLTDAPRSVRNINREQRSRGFGRRAT
jgi:hypothetical protein